MPRKLVGLCAIAGGILLLGGGTPPEDPGQRRLSQLPAEVRRRVGEQLDQALALPASRLAEIRRLDSHLNAVDAGERTRLLDELRRYLLWVESLSPDQQAALEGVSGDGEWRALVSKFQSEEKPPEAFREERIASLRHTIEFGNTSVALETALLLGWRALGEEARKSLPDSTKERGKFRAQILAEARKVLRESIDPPKDDAVLPFPVRLIAQMRRAEAQNEPAAGKAAALRPEQLQRFQVRVSEIVLLEESPPRKTTLDRLERFYAEEIPAWLKGDFENLPPEAARLLLTVMYREVYPFPGEMPEPERQAPAHAAPIHPTF